ncbi:MAG: ATP-dependent DNA helicase RecG [Chloroflexota bacterium]
MTQIFKRLERVLELEAKQGYGNKAVVGGIQQFAVYWVEQAREQATEEADKVFVEQTAEVLSNYGRLSGPEARAQAIERLRESLARRRERIGEPQSAPRPVRQPRKPKPAPPETEQQKAAPRPKAQEKRAEPIQEKAKPAPPPPARKPAVEPDPDGLRQPVTILRGVGPKISERLEKLGAKNIWELLYILPRRYDDYTQMRPINRLVYGEQVTVIGTIWETRARRTRNNQVIVQSVISDGSGSVQATWYNQPWLTEKLKAGMQIVLSGTVEQYLGRPRFNAPQWEPLEIDPLKTRRIVPIYPLTKGLAAHKMRDMMRTAVRHWAERVPETLPDTVRQRQNLPRLPQAVAQAHFPDSQSKLHAARRRMAFDELLLLQLGMQGQRQDWVSQPGVSLPIEPGNLIQFRNRLPFSLTKAQQRVIDEIQADMAKPVPMNRLLQGDVGAGKTVVAAAALFIAFKIGTLSALMAPTAILAEQHYRSLVGYLEPFGVKVAVLTGNTPASEKTAVYAGLADGSIHVAIGTHALIQDAVTFKNLTLAVIDEQHRFGVDQRAQLRQKGVKTGEAAQANPHVLVMSATPIPRTLALSLYGDLDLSILDEMPPGRQEIKTRWLRYRERERAYAFIKSIIDKGQQAYIIYPLVEESDKLDANSAIAEYERLQTQVFPSLKIGLVHGRLRPAEKEAVMRDFYENNINILVATSVIEVGVDVPNSTVILIDGANRFGLAQLHQFRGRVGRGDKQSYCILVADAEAAQAEERLQALEQTNDGFALAEKDLEIRGPGQFFGRQQSGMPELKLASLLDVKLLETARDEAQTLFKEDPNLEQPEHAALRDQVAVFWDNAADVS